MPLSEVVNLGQPAARSSRIDVSAVVYADNRLENVSQLFGIIANTLKDLGKTFEFIFVDDGNSAEISSDLEGFQSYVKNVKVIRLPRRYGPSIAMPVGFKNASGDLILTLGPFLQVYPDQLKTMFEKIDSGFDFVNGWRRNRTDSNLNQAHTRLYNWFVRKFSGVEIHDSNCTLKLFRRDLTDEIAIYGDLYRFLPILAAHQGYLVTEIPVAQKKELNTVGVYSLRTYIGRFLDLITLFFTTRFITRPLRLFGSMGLGFFAAGFAVCSYLVYVKYGLREAIGDRPLLLLGVLLIIVGIQVVSVGLIGELVLYFQARVAKLNRIGQIFK